MSSLKDIILYSTPQGDVHVEVFFNNDTFWLTQKAMTQLFAVAVPAISKHLTNIYNTNELRKEATVSILETVQKEGKRNVNCNSRINSVIRNSRTTAADGKNFETKNLIGLRTYE